MDAITAIQQRVSSPRLTDPAPQGRVLEAIFGAALRAADHGNLRPWRFMVIEGEARQRLGEVFVEAVMADAPGATPAQCEKALQMPLRAPMLVVAIACCREHPKVREVEQIISTGAAVQNMITAAFAQGVGAYWRTGDMAYHPKVAEGLGLGEQERIVGFVYLGTPVGGEKEAPELAVGDFFSRWP